MSTSPPFAPKIESSRSFTFTVSPQVKFSTTLGEFTVQLFPQAAPSTVANFLAYVNQDYYNGTLFHRVIPDFMVQGGGLTADLLPKSAWYSPIELESDNGLKNLVGTIAMARTSVPDSATTEFFISTEDNSFLDYSLERRVDGYAVFGAVTANFSVVKSIEAVETWTINYVNANKVVVFQREDVPVSNILITDASQTVMGSALSNDGVLRLSGLDVTGDWSYSFDAGMTWFAGVGTSIDLPEGLYEVGDIRARQTNSDGQISSVDGLFTYRLIVDETAPALIQSGGLKGVRNLPIDSNLQLTFSEAIQRGDGDIVLASGDGETIARFTPDSPGVVISGETLILDPPANLDHGASYRLLFEPDAIRDAAGNPFLDPGDQAFATWSSGLSYDITAAFHHWRSDHPKSLQGVTLTIDGREAESDVNGRVVLSDMLDQNDGEDDGIFAVIPVFPRVMDKEEADITLSDVITSLRLFLGLSLPATYASPYAHVAADLDGDGRVELSDVIGLLKVFLGLPVTGTQALEWVFIESPEGTSDPSGESALSQAGVDPIAHDFLLKPHVDLVGILRGDVDGSWALSV
jgi:peptidyl-prolyl cis-trans isomerase A (cyclophilin A)